MTFRTILICFTDDESAPRLIRAGCDLARRFGAHLIGLHNLQTISVYPGITAHISGEAAEAFNDAQASQAGRIKKIFLEQTGPEDFVSEWRLLEAPAKGEAPRLIEHTRSADLVIMSQPQPGKDRATMMHTQREIIEESGRPVLVIPTSGVGKTLGTHALIGWSATREATRALHDAIPLIENGGKATIVWVWPTDVEDTYLSQSADEVAASLDRHGAKVTVSSFRLHSNVSVACGLMDEAFDKGADMIVTGAFGHSRFYDFFVGATTPQLLKDMSLPVLFSH